MANDPKDKRKRGSGQSRDVQVSKALSLLLRHAAEKEGLKMNAQGYANVADVVRDPHLQTIIRLFILTNAIYRVAATMAEAQIHQSHLRRNQARCRLIR